MITNTKPTIESRYCFMQSVIIKDGHAQFQHRGAAFDLVSPCFKKLEGKSVLIDSGFEVFRDGKKIGNANRHEPTQ